MADESPSTSVAPLGSGTEVRTLSSRLTVTRGDGFFELSWRVRERAPLLIHPYELPFLAVVAFSLFVLRDSPWLFALALVANAFTSAATLLNTHYVRIERGEVRFASRPISLRQSRFELEDLDKIEVLDTKLGFVVQAMLRDGARKPLGLMRGSKRVDDFLSELLPAVGNPAVVRRKR